MVNANESEIDSLLFRLQCIFALQVLSQGVALGVMVLDY